MEGHNLKFIFQDPNLFHQFLVFVIFLVFECYHPTTTIFRDQGINNNYSYVSVSQGWSPKSFVVRPMDAQPTLNKKFIFCPGPHMSVFCTFNLFRMSTGQ